MSTIQNLKKAYQSQAVTKDTYTLQKFHAKFENNEVSQMIIKAIETKYVPQYDKRLDGGSQGMRTRFILANGESVGTFSNAAYRFFEFFASLMGYQPDSISHFLHIDIDGQIVVNVSEIDLGKNEKGEPTYTYNFDIVEEGSELKGLADYLPSMANVLALDAPQQASPQAESEAKSK